MSEGGTVRRLLARIVAACAAVFWGVFFFGLIDFLTPFTGGEEFAAHYLIETGWGLLYLVLVTVPLVVLAARPGTGAALLELAVVAVAIWVGAALGGSPVHALPGVGVLATALALAASCPPRSWPRLHTPARYTALVSLAACLPVAAYAWEMARATENPEETWGLDHYPAQAAFAVAVVLAALVAASASDRRDGWLLVLTSAFCATWFGALTVAWPERLGSAGTAWGLAAIGWGVALVAAAAVDRRRVDGPVG